MSPDDPTRSAPSDRTTDHVEPSADGTVANVTPSSANALPTVAGYIIERELGRGGMAVVYLAHQPGLNRQVAVKRIGGDGPPDDRAVIRFLAEAENVAAIRHPHVVQVYQFGRDDAGCPFLAMEYLPGGTLADKLRTAEKLPPRTAAELLAAVSEGVAAAHALGIVHRDLKPANVLLDAAGVPKVTDFGLAKRGPGAELTNTGAIMGTPAYMCPEQAGGKTKFVGPPGDVWAVGVMLYECLSGRRPFDADKSWDIIVQVVNAAPAPLRTVCPDVPRDLELVVHKCLAKEPADRYPSAAELAADLRAWLSGRPIAARPLPAWERGWRWAKRNQLTAGALTAAAVLLLAGTGVSLWQMLRANGEATRADARAADAEREQKRAETGEAAAKASALEARRMVGRMAVAEGLRLADTGDTARALAWFARPLRVAPETAADDFVVDRLAGYRWYGLPVLTYLDGDMAIETGDRDRHGRWKIRIENDKDKKVFAARVWDAVTGQPLTPPLQHDDRVNSAAFSPDGRRLATASNDKTARVWAAATGQPHTSPLRHDNFVRSVVFSPDGRRLATASWDSTARVWDAATGQPLTPPLRHDGRVESAAFSPDGRRLATGSQDKTARVWDAATGQPLTPPLRHGGSVESAAFSPDGQRLATACFDRAARVWDVVTGQLVAPPLRHDNIVHSAVFSPDGRRLATACWNCTARVWDAATGQPLTPPLRHDSIVRSAAFSPDGRWLATASKDSSARVWDAAIGQPVTPTFRYANRVLSTAISPDGRRLATASFDYTARVWDATTGHPVTPPFRHDHIVFAAAFSPDGRRLATASNDTTARVWDADTGQPLTPPLQHDDRVHSAVFSPDGRWLATASEDKTARVWDAATGQAVTPPLRHDYGVRSAVFSLDGRRLATASDDKTARVWDAATGQPITPPLPHASTVLSAAFSTDGQRLVTTCMDGKARIWELPTDTRPTADLIKLAHLYAGGRIDDAGGFVPLTADETKALFTELKAKYPADFTVTPAQAAAWHRDQLAAAEADHDWFAARFHLRVLLEKYAFGDIDLAARLRNTREPAPPPKRR